MLLFELVQLINDTFKWPPAKFVDCRIRPSGHPFCRFIVGHREYEVIVIGSRMTVTCEQGKQYASRAFKLLKGYKRNDDGDLQPAA